ncbi:hypothetical protein AH06_87 [Erwinia phage AH06]|nr:hypothetical protein AH06_87 [Erwinia phage AH06]
MPSGKEPASLEELKLGFLTILHRLEGLYMQALYTPTRVIDVSGRMVLWCSELEVIWGEIILAYDRKNRDAIKAGTERSFNTQVVEHEHFVNASKGTAVYDNLARRNYAEKDRYTLKPYVVHTLRTQVFEDLKPIGMRFAIRELCNQLSRSINHFSSINPTN